MSGVSLYRLIGEYREAADRLAELDLPAEVVADTLDSLTGDIETKATGIAHVLMSFTVAAAAIKEHATEQMKRSKALDARADQLRAYLANSMEAVGIAKIEGPSVRLSFRKSSAVVIDFEDLIPADLMRAPVAPPPAPDKTAIKAAIASGREVPGAHIEVRHSLQISP